MRRRTAILSVVLLAAISTAAPALAVEPPQVPPGPPIEGPVAPPTPTEQNAACRVGALLPGSDPHQRPMAEAMLDYRRAWQYSRGAGQKVAVIDTGVARSPRLAALEGGGDYVSATDGLVDCDLHGTLVAGLIAATPGPDDAFAGVAPDASILSIRQNSAAFTGKSGGADSSRSDVRSQGYGNAVTLALAITHAVDLGATVINLSEAACVPSSAGIDDAVVGLAVRDAFERNVVVVAAAGNVSSEGSCSVQNDVRDPNLPLADAWKSVSTIASPAWYSDYVLTVGAVTPDAAPSGFSLRGPWVDVAAPGEMLTSLSPVGPGIVNATLDAQRGPLPINGTSFAAPLVSGTVALIRSRFPTLTAGEVMDRVKRTAHTPESGPNAATGYGVVDPIAALTADLPPPPQTPPGDPGTAIAGPRPDPRSGHRARDIALTVAAVCGVLGLLAPVIKRPAAETGTATTPGPRPGPLPDRVE